MKDAAAAFAAIVRRGAVTRFFADNKTAVAFVAVLTLFGVAQGFVVARWPELESSAVPTFLWPILASLVIDVAIRPAVASGRIADLRTETRFAGVLAGVLAYTVVRWAIQG
jgi:hypothetical protein